MKRVHIAPTLLDAQLVVDALSSLGIVSHIFNANAAGALGEVPFLQAQPEVWVEDDTRECQAREVLVDFLNVKPSAEKICPHCGEHNPGNFLSCWQCGSQQSDKKPQKHKTAARQTSRHRDAVDTGAQKSVPGHRLPRRPPRRAP